MEIDEQKMNPESTNLDSLDVFLNLFIWPIPNTCEKLREIQDPTNFNEDNYDEGVGAYLKWLNDSLPNIKTNSSTQEQHCNFRLQIFALINKHDPAHPILEMLKSDH